MLLIAKPALFHEKLLNYLKEQAVREEDLVVHVNLKCFLKFI